MLEEDAFIAHHMPSTFTPFTLPPSPSSGFRLTLIPLSLTLEIIVDTPIETEREQDSATETNAHAQETTRDLYGVRETPTALAADADAPATGRASEPAWGLLAAFAVWFASVGLLLVGGLVAVIVYGLVRLRSFNAADLQRAVESDPVLILFSIVAMIPVHLLTFVVAWAVVTSFNRRPFRETVGWSWSERFGFWSCVGVAAGLWLFGVVLAMLFGGQETDIDQIIASSGAARFSVAFLAVATAPIVEETVYRGVIYAPLERAAGKIWAIVVVTAMFAGVHVHQYRKNLAVILAVVVLSFVLTWVRAQTGRLFPCFVIHTLFNGIQAILIIAQPYFKTPPSTQPSVPQGFVFDALARAFAFVGL